MYCANCGKELPDGARFCPGCGAASPHSSLKDKSINSRWTRGAKLLKQTNDLAAHLVPRKIRTAFPGVMPIIVVGVYFVAFVLIVAVSSAFISGRHDLSGTYQTGEFFPIQQITFDESGNFSAVNSGNGYTEIYQGKYKKKINGKYSCQFTGGASEGGSPVTQYEADSMGKQCELSVQKVDENTLEIWIIPKVSYYAWAGTSVYFYK